MAETMAERERPRDTEAAAVEPRGALARVGVPRPSPGVDPPSRTGEERGVLVGPGHRSAGTALPAEEAGR
ncbi:hypothetical protein QMZ92_06925 [Streptomyces sp. HNM0645]|uniref:hypothetical protein n=1 Tax=Streptomyces sp. HNM0645 TaxID=2782343 RepID=UPI0024B7AC6C|nr:hypothetical protein [Streptomyces sp. HNM0645]MDI9884135.1 hypothetical protein [Streptomyces sp. HNM0645]